MILSKLLSLTPLECVRCSSSLIKENLLIALVGGFYWDGTVAVLEFGAAAKQRQCSRKN